MKKYRYSQWDGSQDTYIPNAEELMNELGQNLMSYGDISYVLRTMQRNGVKDSQGRRLPGVQELLQRLRQARQGQLEKYNLNSVIDELRNKLDDILKQERVGIQRRLDDAKKKAKEGGTELDKQMQKRLLKTVQDMAAERLKKLDNLPQELGGKVKELTQYDFMDDQARRQFQELMDTLKRHATGSYARSLMESLKNTDARTMAAMRHLVEALNQLIEQRLKGQEPDFESFMQEFGQFFGPNPPKSLDELLENLQNQMAQAKSLLDSLSPEDREALKNALNSALDEGTRYEMAKLAVNLDALHPNDRLSRQYQFSGEEPIPFQEALKLMETLQNMDKLESQLRDAQYNRSLDSIDEKLLQETMGRDAATEIDKLRRITKLLEDAGYIRFKDGKYELTPRGLRRIGQQALEDIFAELRRDRAGPHNIRNLGAGGERTFDTRKYAPGDEFQIHLQHTIMNSICREPGKVPVKLKVDDFEVIESEERTRSATVLLLDLSLSMPMRGNFQAAKRVAVALDTLIRSQYPKDSLRIIGFSSYAREIKKEDLSVLSWDEFDPYTNMQHGLYLARRLLIRERCSNKQVILISDGEPTAHIEEGNVFFQYPPSLRTLQLTMREVRNCTQSGIVINTFMLESGRFFSAFVNQMARINKGRVFFTRADNLGQYLLVDYITNKKKKI